MRLSEINKLILLSITLALAACNGGGGGSSLAGNSAPVIDGGEAASISIDENTTAATTVTATDSDAGDTLTFSLIGGDDQSLLSISTGGGAFFSYST